ncbi:MAG: 2,3-bisphosphoglycerate-independent phosphoglycerate mutase, partial [Planctomycetota bacterium]
MKHRPLLLVVLDGWGHRAAREHNAIRAEAHYFHELLARYPNTLLSASGEEVGLPLGLMGNSEVGHMNLGAGRIVWQEISRIDKSIRDGDFFTNPALRGAMEGAKARAKRLHLFGLVSDGGVHASDHHLRNLLELARRVGLPKDDVLVHAVLDGRDTPPRSGAGYVAKLEEDLARVGVGRVATVVGRYWAMDRDKRWERVEKAYRLFVQGQGEVHASASAAVAASYAREVGDEFVEPCVIGAREASSLGDGDALLCFNFRADRMREICQALALDAFDGFERGPRPALEITTMTRYHAGFPFPVAYAPKPLEGVFSELVSARGLRQERIAETEKYAHVTFFFSGGKEAELAGESRCLV